MRPRNRRPVRHTIGRFPTISVDTARREARSFIAEMQTTGDLERVRAKKRGQQTLGWLFYAYLERHSKVHKRTWREDEANWRRYLEKPLGRLPLDEISRERVSMLHSRITATGAPVAANRALALLSSLFSWAINAGIWGRNPAQGIRRNSERSRSRFLTDAEMARLQAVLDADSPSPRSRSISSQRIESSVARRAPV